MRGESADGTIDRGIALLTDGGEAVQEEQDEDAEQGEDQGDEQEAEQAEGEQEEDAAGESSDETAEGESDAQELADEAEDHAEEWEGISEEIEEAEGVHRGDAETVYESDDATGVLHLDLGGLTVDLLGLEIHLNDVVLNVGARPGDNKLLGNLLSAVTGLLDGLAASPMKAVKNALGKAKDAVAGVFPSFGDIKNKLASVFPSFGGIKDKLAGFLPDFGGIKDRITGLVPSLGGIKSAILGLVPGVGGGDEEASEEGEEAEGEDDAESGDEAEGEEEAESEEESEESPGVLARLKGWVGDKLRGALSALPIQEVAANVAREMLRELIEQIESKDKPESQDGGATAEAES